MADCFFNYTTATDLVTYSTNIGDGVNSVFVVPHNLGTKDVSVTVRDTQTNLLAYPAIEVITLSSVSVSFNFVPTLTAYDVTIFAAASAIRVEPFSDRVVINIDEQPAQNVTVSISSVGESVNVDVIDFLAQWGSIVGVLSAQTDLWSQLSAKALNINLISLSSQFIDLNTLVQTYSALWEESADIIPTVTNYLSTNCILLSCLNVSGQMLSAGIPLHDIFLTAETDSQTLSYTASSLQISISNGNNITLDNLITKTRALAYSIAL